MIFGSLLEALWDAKGRLGDPRVGRQKSTGRGKGRGKPSLTLARLLRDTRIVPSRSTLYSHRLTLHQGWCAILGEEYERIAWSPGGSVSWKSMDLSPLNGVEYCMHGISIMKQSDVVTAYELFLVIYSDPEGSVEENRCLEELLRLSQGIPVGLGSGRKALKYKYHSVAHANRLTVRRWKTVGKIMNESVATCGDLGEAKNDIRFDLRQFFGQWIVRDDYGEDTSTRLVRNCAKSENGPAFILGNGQGGGWEYDRRARKRCSKSCIGNRFATLERFGNYSKSF